MRRILFSFIALGLVLVPGAHAATVTYSERGSWTAATTSLVNFDSGTQAAGTITYFSNATGLVTTSLQITGYNSAAGGGGYELSRVNADASQTWYDWGTGAIIRSADKTSTNTVYVRIAFNAPVTSFGFNYGGGGAPPASLTIAPQGLATITTTTATKHISAVYVPTHD